MDRTLLDLAFESEDLFELYCPCSEPCLATVFAKNSRMCSPLEKEIALYNQYSAQTRTSSYIRAILFTEDNPN